MNSEELLRVRPTSASIAQSVEWIQYICNAHRKELLEKKNILERINYSNSDGISFLYGQWARPIHLDTSISASFDSSMRPELKETLMLTPLF